MKTEIINYDIDGKDFLGYAAFPDGDNFPAVIIAHTWSGRDQFVDEKAEKLAENGYLGFALDMYLLEKLMKKMLLACSHFWMIEKNFQKELRQPTTKFLPCQV